uniref:V-type proton ATPase proteolipid subunit n=1 Tax=Euplotes harpa TaxID=151035 RepID=A0A7S3JDC6_9SPIT|mmetsp:Transcript_31479/g.35956  ORF Transcript_31479/g.35956 Transcript_31479/m.35956 type:complete len:161 (+) Transcript_31479:28-510(+)
MILELTADLPYSPAGATFFGFMGVAISLACANIGAAYGTAKSGIGISTMGVLKPDLIVKSLVPIIMAGILGIYGLIIAVILLQKIDLDGYTPFKGFQHFASGVCCGLSSLAAGYAIGIVGDSGVKGNAQEPKLFVGMILILIFAEAIGLYGLIIGIILSQ